MIELILWILAARAFDLATTWLATPDLARELNPMVRLLGWRRTILLNLLICPSFAALGDIPIVTLVVASVLCGFLNLWVWSLQE